MLRLRGGLHRAACRPRRDDRHTGRRAGIILLLGADHADGKPLHRTDSGFSVRAAMQLSAGITADVEFTLLAGAAAANATTGYALRVRMRAYEAFDLPGSLVTIPIVVKR